MPLAQWANGDFSGLTYNGNPVTIYNPYSTYTCTQNGKPQICRNPFPNNQIPANMINPIAQKLLSFYPKPNQAGNPGTPWQGNYYTQEPTGDKYRNALIKLDWAATQNDKFSLRYGYWERYETVISNGIPGPAANGEQPLGDIARTLLVRTGRTPLLAKLVLDLKANLNLKTEVADVARKGSTPDPSGGRPRWGWLGRITYFRVSIPAALRRWETPEPATELPELTPSIFSRSVTWSKGKHTLHAGVDWRFGQYSIVENASTNGSLSFNQQWTQNCWSCAAGSDYTGPMTNSEGNTIASMLLGSGSGGRDRHWIDSVLFNPILRTLCTGRLEDPPQKLTLNLGVRYDLQPYYIERNNRADYAFDTTTVNPVDAMLPFHTLANGQSFVDEGRRHLPGSEWKTAAALRHEQGGDTAPYWICLCRDRQTRCSWRIRGDVPADRCVPHPERLQFHHKLHQQP